MTAPRYVAWFETVGMADVDEVGGKAASLGELSRALGGTGAVVPGGFAVTAAAYRAMVSRPPVRKAIARALEARARGEPAGAPAAAIRAAIEAEPLHAPSLGDRDGPEGPDVACGNRQPRAGGTGRGGHGFGDGAHP